MNEIEKILDRTENELKEILSVTLEKLKEPWGENPNHFKELVKKIEEGKNE